MGKLTSSFISLKGNRYSVEIANANISEDREIFLSADPVHLIVANNEIKYQGLRSTECQINIISKDDLIELYTEDILGTTVIVRKIEEDNNNVIFAGFLEPSQWNQPAQPGALNELQIVAIDAWSAMKQYPMYDRIAAKFSWWIAKMRSLINDAFFSTGVDIIAFANSPEFDDTFIVNNDALMPSDLYAEEGFDKFPTYGDILKEVGMAINRSFVMIGSSLEMYDVDAVNDLWTGHAENHLRSTNVSIEIVPSLRSVIFEADYPPQLENPKLKEGSTAIGYYVNTKELYAEKYVYLYSARPDKGLYWENYNLPPVPSISLIGGSWNLQAIMGVNYADDLENLTRDKNDFILGISAISSPIHTRVGSSFKIEADIFINPEFNNWDVWEVVPTIWKAGRMETRNNSTIAIYVSGQILGPSIITTDFEEAQPGWQHCTYDFYIPESIDSNGNVKIIVRSPNLDSALSGYHFAKNIKFIHNDNDYHLKHRIPCNGKSTGEDLDLDCILNTVARETGTQTNNGSIQGDTPGQTIAGTMTAISQQYSQPRRQWAMTIYDTNYDPRRKVIYNGITCTQMGSDWDLRNDMVTAKILESK